MLQVSFGSAKVSKYAVRESGDTLEFIERPQGGISAVLADGQRSGVAAKRISNIVARKAISLLGEGVRDGAAARAAHDYLRTHRGGQVSAELQIVSIDLVSRTVVVSRNSHCPALILRKGQIEIFDDESAAIGFYDHTKPVIREYPLEAGLTVIVYTDGMLDAGKRCNGCLDLPGLLMEQAKAQPSAQSLADVFLNAALDADKGRPIDDTAVLVVRVTEMAQEDGVRRLSMRIPV